MTTFGIVVAAGSGERFGRPKADIELDGRPLWKWAATAMRSGGCDDVVVVGDVPGGIAGGARRRDSVGAGLAAAPEHTTYVIVHDAARPLASATLVRRVVEALASGTAEAVIPGIPVRDTLKETKDHRVTRTVDRSRLVAVQTPQGFSYRALVAAHELDTDDATDDAALIERAGGQVAVIPGEEHNLKVTYPGDLAVLEAWIR